MTDEVYKQCAIRNPVVIQLMRPAEQGKPADPPSVSLECFNGHWAEYDCPKSK